MTSSLNIGTILELIRDEVKITIPHALDACLLLFDPEAPRYTRPLHCAIYKERINCPLCKHGPEAIQRAITHPLSFQCSIDPESNSTALSNESDKPVWEIAIPIKELDDRFDAIDVNMGINSGAAFVGGHGSQLVPALE
jgi:hypothetical protein